MSKEKIIVTPDDLEENPGLKDAGVEPGEEIELGDDCNEDGTPADEPDGNRSADSEAPGEGPGPRPKDRNNP